MPLVRLTLVLLAAVGFADLILHIESFLDRREARRRNQAHPIRRNRR